MALILDHVNGIADDHRLENLQIVCPNCAATLETHCGKNLRRERHRRARERACEVCGVAFLPVGTRDQRYCSHACGHRSPAALEAHLRNRRVQRPPLVRLAEEVAASSSSAVGRRYGVSNNAIRRWLRGAG